MYTHITLQGILLLKHLLSYKPAKTKPLVFNGKLMSVDFRIKLNNKTKIPAYNIMFIQWMFFYYIIFYTGCVSLLFQ